MICIYHSRDLDGWTSGALVKLKYPDCKMIGYDYGEPFPWNEIPIGEAVIMADVSLPMKNMSNLALQTSHRLVWIDHHISAINDFKASLDPCLQSTTAVLDNTISACEGTWNYLFPDKQMPEAVKLLGEYDTWRNKDQDRWETKILPFQFGMRTLCQSPETFPYYLLDNDIKDIVEVTKYGNIILHYQRQVNEHQCKRAFESIITINNSKLSAICHNAGGFNSDMFKSVYNPEKHDIMVMFQYDGKTKLWVVSLYSTQPEIDCSILAKSMGGGGHKGAAGFQVKHLDGIFEGMEQTKPNPAPAINQMPQSHTEFCECSHPKNGFNRTGTCITCGKKLGLKAIMNMKNPAAAINPISLNYQQKS